MKSVLTAAFLALSVTPAIADGYAHNHNVAIILEVTPHFNQRPIQTTRQVCYQEQVPVRRYSDGGDVLTGALIGAAIGNQFGSGSGNDAMTILGAIVGANSGSRSQPVVGYETVHNCRNETTVQYVEEFSHFSVIFLENGQRYRTETTRNFFVGDRVPSHELY